MHAIGTQVDRVLFQVNSLNKQGLLLEVLEVLADVDLFINKSYISSDAGWFMDGMPFLEVTRASANSRNRCDEICT